MKKLKKIYDNDGDIDPATGLPSYGSYIRNKFGMRNLGIPTTTGKPVAGYEPIEGASHTNIAPNATAPVAAGSSPLLNTLNTIKGGVDKAAPFLSNAINALRKPPAPTRGRMLNPVSLAKVDYSGERASIDSQTAAANKGADQGVDGQTAAAIRGANAARNFDAKGQSYEREANANSAISNQQAQLNAGIEAQNLGREDKYNDDVISMKLANQREQSQNLANASDKYVAEKNADAARALDKEKFRILSKVYSNGIVDRINQGAYGGKLKYADGGTIEDPTKPTPKKTTLLSTSTSAAKAAPVYQTQADVNKANSFAQDFVVRHDNTRVVGSSDVRVASKPGDPVVPFVNPDGSAYKPSAVAKPTVTSLPSWLAPDDIQGDATNGYFFEDKNGHLQNIDGGAIPAVEALRSRARVSNEQAAADAAARGVRALGGKLNLATQMPRMRGKIKKVLP
jgi:hypothetical protein